MNNFFEYYKEWYYHSSSKYMLFCNKFRILLEETFRVADLEFLIKELMLSHAKLFFDCDGTWKTILSLSRQLIFLSSLIIIRFGFCTNELLTHFKLEKGDLKVWRLTLHFGLEVALTLLALSQIYSYKFFQTLHEFRHFWLTCALRISPPIPI